MKLYLVRHGEALSEEVDPERSLSERGRQEVTKVAEYLRAQGATPARIQHSSKARARQTAEIIAEALDATNRVDQREGLAPNDPVRPIADEIAGARKDLMFVGHLPFMPRLAHALIGPSAPSGIAGLAVGGVLILEGEGRSFSFVRRLLPDDV